MFQPLSSLVSVVLSSSVFTSSPFNYISSKTAAPEFTSFTQQGTHQVLFSVRILFWNFYLFLGFHGMEVTFAECHFHTKKVCDL